MLFRSQVRRTGGLFGGSRALSTGRTETPQAQPLPEKAAPKEKRPEPVEPKAEKPAIINGDTISQAWMSFALTLPENQRALADRMKIMTPTFEGNTTFTISVDNQLAAELFEKESKRICTGMSEYMNGTIPVMKINVNKIVVERHVSDRTKQYEVLKEKNPLLEKMRVALNLELAR